MAVIQTIAAALAELLDEAALRAHVERISAEARRGAALVDDLLLVDEEKHAGWVEVGAVLGEAEPLLRELISDAVALELRVERAPAVWISPLHVERILVNLVANADAAMEQGGRVSISVRCEGVRPARTVVLRVEDDGPGMAPEVLERAFEPFFSTKPTSTSGLGLATSRRLVTVVGGSMEITSRVGIGTVVTVRLPAAEDLATATPPGPHA